jgi:hypothetical protein
MKYLALIFILVFSACSTKNYEHTQTKIVIIKSPKIKFSDLGYLRNSDDSVELELFMAGKAMQKIAINHLICVNEGCMSKSAFNKEYMSEYYPDDTIQSILLAKPIYEGKNLEKTSKGFVQKISDENVDILYRVTQKQIFFKDRKNRIIFKIKETK